MPDPIRQRVEVQADDAQRELKETSRATDDMSRSTREAGEEANRASSEHDDLAKKLAGIVSVAALAEAAFSAYNDMVRANTQALKENAEQADRVAKASLDLSFLQAASDPEEREFAQRAAVFAGRDPTEGLTAFGRLKSLNPQATQKELRGLFAQVVAKGQQTQTPLGDLVQAFDVINKFVDDPVASGNILDQAITEAGEIDPAKLSPLIGQFLGTAVNIGKLEPGEAVGLLAGATGLGLPREKATTGLLNIVLALSGKNEQGRRILTRAGVGRGDPIEQLREISKAIREGRLPEQDLEAIVGRDALPLASALADERLLEGRVLSSAANVQAAGQRSESQILEKSSRQFREDLQLALSLATDQSKAEEQFIRGQDTVAQQVAAARAALSLEAQRLVQEGKITRSRAKILLEGSGELGFLPLEIEPGFDKLIGNATTDSDLSAEQAIEQTLQNLIGNQSLSPFSSLSGEEGELLLNRVRSRLQSGPQINITNVINSNVHQNDPREIDAANRQ